MIPALDIDRITPSGRAGDLVWRGDGRRRRFGRFNGVVAALGSLWLAALSPGANLLVNGDFSDGVNNWQSAGRVAPLDGLAVVTDDGATRSLLWQTAAIPAGRFEVEFEFRNLFSNAVPAGTLLDSGFVSIYFFSNPQAFDPLDSGTFESATGLLDLDANGPSNFPADASLLPADCGSDYVRFNGFFENTGSLFFALVFDLVDLNFVNDDSAFVINRASVARTAPSGIEIAKDGEFIRVRFQGTLQMSVNVVSGSWTSVPGAQSPTLIVSPEPGQTPRFRASALGSTPGSVQTSEFLGLTRIDFTGLLEFACVEGIEEWRSIPGAKSPIFVKTPVARDRFLRAVQN
jgi:hypothetical protein